jgi:MinD-like ATPase involved in chromosome partitioning or flagellar assembly
VVIAADGAPWEAELLNAADSPELGITVVRRCLDVVELVSVALAGQAQAALLSYPLRDLDRDIVDQLASAGVAAVAVATDADGTATHQVAELGFRRVAASADGPEHIAALVRDAVARPVEPDAHSFALAGPPSSSLVGPSPLAAVTEGEANIIAVWGPAGAPGRTTVALGLADEIARLGAEVLLVDADVYGGTVATRLGILDESPGLAAACRAVTSGALEPDTLARLAWQLAPRLRVLTGLPLAQRWPELRPTALKAVLEAGRGFADWIIVDVGFSIEADEELSFDSIAPRRNGATLAVLDAAHVAVVVGECDPIGMQRLAYALLEYDELGTAADVRIALNKVRPGFGNGDPRVHAAAALRLAADREPSAYLPYDRDALDASLMGGRSLREVRPRSGLRQALVQLAHDLTGITSSARRRHAQR